MAWAEECLIIVQIKHQTKTYVNRLKSVLRSHDDLLNIYTQSYKPGNLIIAETLEDKARIYTHLIQHDKAKKHFVQMEKHYDLVEHLLIKSYDMKEGTFKKECLLGEYDFRINYRMLGEYYLHRHRDLAEECNFEMVEELFKKSIDISRQWAGEYDYRLGVAYSCLVSLYHQCGLTEEASEIQNKLMHWHVLQHEMEQSERATSHKNCLLCPNFACIECYSCICQTKLTVKRLDEFEDFFDIMRQVFYECGTTVRNRLQYEYM